jgi:hypothetical protein
VGLGLTEDSSQSFCACAIPCGRWIWRNAEFPKIRPETRNAAINLDYTILPFARLDLEDARVQLATLAEEFCGGRVGHFILDSSNRSKEFVSDGDASTLSIR